jgi:hypothetical protein
MLDNLFQLVGEVDTIRRNLNGLAVAVTAGINCLLLALTGSKPG